MSVATAQMNKYGTQSATDIVFGDIWEGTFWEGYVKPYM